MKYIDVKVKKTGKKDKILEDEYDPKIFEKLGEEKATDKPKTTSKNVK